MGRPAAAGGLNMENAMYYESYERKKPHRRKRRRGGCLGALLRFFGKLIALALVLAVLKVRSKREQTDSDDLCHER